MSHTITTRTTIVVTLALFLGAAVVWAQGTGGGTVPTTVGPAAATVLQWFIDPGQALAAARAAGRPVYIYIWAKYNPDCVKMADETLTYDQVIAQLALFQLVALDAHNRANFGFFDQYKIPYFRVEGPAGPEVPHDAGVVWSGGGRYPTSLFLDSQGREVYRMFGYVGGAGFAVRLAQVTEALKAWDNLRANPTSAPAEFRVGHAYMELQVLPEARTHLQQALKLDPQNLTGVAPDARLDLLIMAIPDDPGNSIAALQQWQKQNANHPRRLEATYYEAATNVAVAEGLMAAAPEGTKGLTKEALARLDAATRILQVFKQSKPGSVEHESQWYMAAMELLTGIDKVLHPDK